MFVRKGIRPLAYPGLVAAFVATFAAGCGWLADPDRIAVAKINDKVIRREDLEKVLREMLTEERPHIRSRSDLLRVLEDHIDRTLKHALAAELQEQGKIDVSREVAANQFDAMHPKYRSYIENGEAMGMTQSERTYFQEEREILINRLRKDLLGEAAVEYRAIEESKAGTLTITDQEYRDEYEYAKEELKNYETVAFEAVYFPKDQPDASTIATRALERLRAGEEIRDLAAEYTAAGTGFSLNSVLRKDPRSSQKFQSFWQQASGAKTGDALGPIFITGWHRTQADDQGRVNVALIPDAFLVCKVRQAVPESVKSLEEAKPELAARLLYAKMIRKLREENGVEVYEERLPNPAASDDSAPKSIFDEQPPQ